MIKTKIRLTKRPRLRTLPRRPRPNAHIIRPRRQLRIAIRITLHHALIHHQLMTALQARAAIADRVAGQPVEAALHAPQHDERPQERPAQVRGAGVRRTGGRAAWEREHGRTHDDLRGVLGVREARCWVGARASVAPARGARAGLVPRRGSVAERVYICAEELDGVEVGLGIGGQIGDGLDGNVDGVEDGFREVFDAGGE